MKFTKNNRNTPAAQYVAGLLPVPATLRYRQHLPKGAGESAPGEGTSWATTQGGGA